MANLTEVVQFDAGVYQLETTDPVQGGANGVSNAPLKNLANRTAYLKKHIDDLESGVFIPSAVATLASPAFTGSPTAPTQSLGNNTTRIATTAFVQGTVGGRLAKSVAGGVNVTLTAVEAGNAILEFTGALTANIAVIVPTSPTAQWIVKNSTSGAFTLTVKTAAGSGVVVTQGKTEAVYTDGTNVLVCHDDYADIALTGVPTAPTATTGTNTTQVASTAFVCSAIGNQSGYGTFAAGVTIPVSGIGKTLAYTGAAASTVTLPLSSSVPVGSTLTLYNSTIYQVLLSRNTSGVIATPLSDANTFPLRPSESVVLVNDGANWRVIGGSAASSRSGGFNYQPSSAGFQMLPSGLIIQWGITGLISADGTLLVALPVAFTTANLSAVCMAQYSSAPNAGFMVSIYGRTLTNMSFYNSNTGAALSATWFAIGY